MVEYRYLSTAVACRYFVRGTVMVPPRFWDFRTLPGDVCSYEVRRLLERGYIERKLSGTERARARQCDTECWGDFSDEFNREGGLRVMGAWSKTDIQVESATRSIKCVGCGKLVPPGTELFRIRFNDIIFSFDKECAEQFARKFDTAALKMKLKTYRNGYLRGKFYESIKRKV